MKSIGFEIKEINDLIIKKITREAHLENRCVISPTQVKIVCFLEKNDKVYQRDIEDYLKSKRSTVSGILDTMEKNNLIKRISDSKDLRLKQIVLTEYAIDKISSIKSKLNQINKNLGKDISKSDLDVFFKVTEQIKNNINIEEE